MDPLPATAVSSRGVSGPLGLGGRELGGQLVDVGGHHRRARGRVAIIINFYSTVPYTPGTNPTDHRKDL